MAELHIFRGKCVMLVHGKLPCLVDARNKLVRDDLAILRPVLPILLGAPLKVSRTTMDEYDNEEDAVEVGDG